MLGVEDYYDAHGRIESMMIYTRQTESAVLRECTGMVPGLNSWELPKLVLSGFCRVVRAGRSRSATSLQLRVLTW